MRGAPELIDAVSAPTAVVRARTTWQAFRGLIRGMFDEVYGSGVALRGANVIVYRVVGDGRDGGALDMEVGVRLDAPVELRGALVASETPAGRAASAVHVGPYDRMGETYDALHAWVRARGLRLGDAFWEVYGDWAEDPEQLETWIYHRVEG
jgi:effector-binding domain-containing protein